MHVDQNQINAQNEIKRAAVVGWARFGIQRCNDTLMLVKNAEAGTFQRPKRLRKIVRRIREDFLEVLAIVPTEAEQPVEEPSHATPEQTPIEVG